MAEPIVLVDPLCLCGRPHPCNLHGAWIGTPATLFDAFVDPLLLIHRLLDEDRFIHAKGA